MGRAAGEELLRKKEKADLAYQQITVGSSVQVGINNCRRRGDFLSKHVYHNMDCIAYIISPKSNAGAHKSRHPLFRTWERKSATYCAPQCETIDYDRRTNSNSLVYVSVYGIFYELLKQYIAIYIVISCYSIVS